MIKLTIDGKIVQAENGATILEAARQTDIDIPTLCHIDKLPPNASCFVCAVRVDGSKNFAPSCATHVREGMIVDTCSEEVADCRRRAIDLLLSTHAGECEMPCSRGGAESVKCKMNGKAKCFRCACDKKLSCKLRQYALQYGVGFYSYGNNGKHKRKTCESGLVHEPGKCIVCGKCVSITREKNIKPGLSFCNRGSNVCVSAPFGVDIDNAIGEALKECVDACPTGALWMIP